MRRISEAREQVETWRTIETQARDLADLHALAESEDDQHVAEEVSSEADALAARLEDLELELALSGEYDRRDAIFAVHAGAGGTDSQDWADCESSQNPGWPDCSSRRVISDSRAGTSKTAEHVGDAFLEFGELRVWFLHRCFRCLQYTGDGG